MESLNLVSYIPDLDPSPCGYCKVSFKTVATKWIGFRTVATKWIGFRTVVTKWIGFPSSGY